MIYAMPRCKGWQIADRMKEKKAKTNKLVSLNEIPMNENLSNFQVVKA